MSQSGPVASLMLAALVTSSLSAQAEDDASTQLIEALRAQAHAVWVEEGRLVGPGAEWIYREIEGARFVGIGERHGIAEIAELSAVLLDYLDREHAFTTVAVENGPRAMEALGRASSAGEGPYSFARRHPGAIAFSMDQDLGFYGSALSLLGAEGVWGFDQEYGTGHVWDQVPPRYRPPPATLETVRERGTDPRRDGFMPWIRTAEAVAMLSGLRDAAAQDGDTAAARILGDLLVSARVYDLYRRSGEGEPTGYGSNVMRENHMKDNFLVAYRAHQRRTGTPPRVLVKAGSAHIGRGQGPFGPFSFGGFLDEFARAEGGTFLNLMVLAHGDSTGTGPTLWRWPAMRPVAEVAAIDGWTLFDLRPLRGSLYAGRFGTPGRDLVRTIFGYDAIVILGGARRQTTTGVAPQ